jgi:hypothetical protein
MPAIACRRGEKKPALRLRLWIASAYGLAMTGQSN